jgi:hypothetical protein
MRSLCYVVYIRMSSDGGITRILVRCRADRTDAVPLFPLPNWAPPAGKEEEPFQGTSCLLTGFRNRHGGYRSIHLGARQLNNCGQLDLWVREEEPGEPFIQTRGIQTCRPREEGGAGGLLLSDRGIRLEQRILRSPPGQGARDPLFLEKPLDRTADEEPEWNGVGGARKSVQRDCSLPCSRGQPSSKSTSARHGAASRSARLARRVRIKNQLHILAARFSSRSVPQQKRGVNCTCPE